MTKEPTPEQIQQAMAELEAGQAARRAESAKAAAQEPPRPDFSRLRPSDFDRQSLPALTEQQVGEMVTAWRASYAQYDDTEIVRLLEAKLAAALKADGYALPPQPAADRLRELQARHARRR